MMLNRVPFDSHRELVAHLPVLMSMICYLLYNSLINLASLTRVRSDLNQDDDDDANN